MKEQLLKLDKKNNEQHLALKKKDETIASMKREIIGYKKQTAELSYQWKICMAAQNRLLEQVRKLNDEIKAKGLFIIALERERRKLNGEGSSQGNQGAQRSRQINEESTSGRRRSASVDRLSDSRRQLARQLLTANQCQAYTVSKKENSIESTEKLVLLQKMLLSKTRTLAEKEVIIEELNEQIAQLKVQLSRLSKARLMAQELTSSRHRVTQLSQQLQDTKKQLTDSSSYIRKLEDKLSHANSQSTMTVKN